MNQNKKPDITRYAPPGSNIKQQTDFFIVGNIISIIYSLYFFVEYFNNYQNLFEFDGTKRILISGAQMPDFPLILNKFLIGIPIVAICMMFYVVFYYASYYQGGSKSIYLMKRLPKKSELHKRAWTLPLIFTAITLLIGFLVAVFYLCFYLLITPEQSLRPDQWQKFWSYFSYFI